MKVYYVRCGNLNGCYNVRCLFPLQANGWDGDRTSFKLDGKTPEDKSRAAISADVVVFHRPDRPQLLELARILKGQGKKIVFDNDDTCKDTSGFKFNEFFDEKRLESGLGKMNDSLDAFIKEADLVTCSTEPLKEEYGLINPNVVVLPNTVDPFYWPDIEDIKKNATGVVRIGITGSVGVTSDLEPLKPIIDHYQNDPRVRLVVFSLPPHGQNEVYKELYVDEYAYWQGVNVEWHPFAEVDEYYDVLNGLELDMVIIPRYDSLFNRCKSNLKFLENSMLEIPTVAQSFPTKDSPYERNPDDAKHLLLAGTTEEWVNQIEKLVTDKEFRVDLGKRAREYVIENYGIDGKAHLWAEAYATLFNS